MKTLIKSKIVLEDNGKSLVTYMWKKKFWIFGYWYPFGTCHHPEPIKKEKINRINDNSISEVLYSNFIRGHY